MDLSLSLSLSLSDFLLRCDFGMRKLWSSNLRNSPLTAIPLLFDVDGDGYKDIVASSFSGEVWAVHGESGHIVDNWPFFVEDRAFHASPLVVGCLCLGRRILKGGGERERQRCHC